VRFTVKFCKMCCAASTKHSGHSFFVASVDKYRVPSLSFREPLRLVHLSANRVQTEWPFVAFEDWRHQD
jgi:hypothetical protein